MSLSTHHKNTKLGQSLCDVLRLIEQKRDHAKPSSNYASVKWCSGAQVLCYWLWKWHRDQPQNHQKLFLCPHSQNVSCSNVHLCEIITLVLKNSFGCNWDCSSVRKRVVELDYDHALDQKKQKEQLQVEKRTYSNQANHLWSLVVGHFFIITILLQSTSNSNNWFYYQNLRVLFKDATGWQSISPTEGSDQVSAHPVQLHSHIGPAVNHRPGLEK